MVRSLQTVALVTFLPVSAASAPSIHPFSRPLSLTSLSSSATGTFQGLGMEMPDIDGIFEKIQQVSPLARSVIQGNDAAGDSEGKLSHPCSPSFFCHRILTNANSIHSDSLKWKTVESNKKKTVQSIQKLDAFGGISTPVFRFQSKLEGPCIGEFFGRFIIDLEERRKWDAQIDNVHELHSIEELERINESHGHYGKCARMGEAPSRPQNNNYFTYSMESTTTSFQS